ncbi:MAG: HAD family hydrolase [Actinobacteria bacterium]|nr:HAD family hydrolase [Actinomycetota bacterium]
MACSSRGASLWNSSLPWTRWRSTRTGTLTHGTPVVSKVQPIDGMTDDLLLALAAAAEKNSEHPIGRCIVREANAQGLSLPPAEFRSVPGRGVEAVVEGAAVRAGNDKLLARPEAARRVAGDVEDGATTVWIEVNGPLAGTISVHDEVRASAPPDGGCTQEAGRQGDHHAHRRQRCRSRTSREAVRCRPRLRRDPPDREGRPGPRAAALGSQSDARG